MANNPTGGETGGGAGDGSNTVDNGPTNTDGPGVNDNDSSGFPARPGRISINFYPYNYKAVRIKWQVTGNNIRNVRTRIMVVEIATNKVIISQSVPYAGEILAGDLHPSTEYLVRVRASNNQGTRTDSRKFQTMSRPK
jgi:hypothetical protein